MQPNMIDSDLWLPNSEQLPCSDDTPVDNEYQNAIPNWLLAVLEEIWADRQDWFFGVDMGVYDREAQRKQSPKIVPDGFLSIGVQRHKRQGKGRLSYVLQEENGVAPLLALEYVSKTYGQEYSRKMTDYADLGVKYYAVYNPEYHQRDNHAPLEAYELIGERYQLRQQEPFWMPEIQLSLGRVRGELGGIQREWLAWHDPSGNPYPLPQELIRQLQGQLQQEQQRAAQLEQALEQERVEKMRLLEQLKQLSRDNSQA